MKLEDHDTNLFILLNEERALMSKAIVMMNIEQLVEAHNLIGKKLKEKGLM